MAYKLLPERGRVFVGSVIAAGSLVIAVSISELLHESFGPRWLILAALTLLSGSATVKLPSVPATISISETFVFTSVLLYGPAAGATIVALDGLIISSWFARRRKELYRILFNMAAPALSIWLAAQFYFLFPGVQPLVAKKITIESLIVPLLVFTILHFLINSALIAIAVAFETGRRVWDIWRKDFLWLSLNYFGGASVSALLVVYTREVDPVYLSIIVPLLLILYFTFKIPMARVEDTNRHLTKVNSLYLSTIETLALAIDAKDQVTHGHIRRVQLFAVSLARAIGIHDEDQLKAIEASALLHDMGKLAVPEHILNKPGKLTPAEFEKMKLHASIGADILSSIEFPYPVVPIVRHHHENWDGTGYPSGISGVDIPIGARILSVVDCFDALTSDRPYRPRLTVGAATKILVDRRSSMYDPLVVDTFVKLQPTLGVLPESSDQQTDQIDEPDRIKGERMGGVARTESGLGRQLLKIYQLLADRSDTPWDDVADLLTQRMKELIPFDCCLIYVYDSANDELVCEYAHGPMMSSLRGRRVALGAGLTGWVAAQRRPQLNSPAALDAYDAVGLRLGCFSNALSVPICRREMLVGVISLYTHEASGFTKKHEDMMIGLARHVAPLINRRRSVGHQRVGELGGALTSADLDKYLRQLRAEHETSTLCLIGIRFPRSAIASVDDVREVYSLLRNGDLVFACDSRTIICLLTDAEGETARAVESRIRQTLGSRIDSVRPLTLAPSGPSSLASMLSDSADSLMLSAGHHPP